MKHILMLPASERIVLWFDGRVRVEVDREEYELIKLMLKDAGMEQSQKAAFGVMRDLESQGYARNLAMMLCIMARRELSGEREPS